MQIKKILHITGLRELGSGQRRQLQYEKNASHKLNFVCWDTVAIHSGDPIEDFEITIPPYLNFLIIRNLYFWLYLLKERKKYDYILFRHIPFDPFSIFFSPFIKNRISVHHSKEVEELKLIKTGWKGRLASNVEKITGKFSLQRSIFIAGVTQEIAIYENLRSNAHKGTLSFPNGIEVNSVDLVPDERDNDSANILFMCSYFSEWHGLDLLLDEIEKADTNLPYFIHLIGQLTTEQNQRISKINSKKIIVHNSLNHRDYFKVAAKCDVGLGSLAMFRNNLHEGSTLKVREMLAMGIPVYSGHIDSAFYNNFKYYHHTNNLKLKELVDFAFKTKGTSRKTIREAATPYIEKETIMQDFINQIESYNN